MAASVTTRGAKKRTDAPINVSDWLRDKPFEIAQHDIYIDKAD